MIGETVTFEKDGRTIQGIVYMHNPELGVIKVADLRSDATYSVRTSDPTLMPLTIDRETGEELERRYVGKTEDPAGD